MQILGGLLGQLGGSGLLDNVLSAEPTDVGRGNDVLGQIFGPCCRSPSPPPCR